MYCDGCVLISLCVFCFVFFFFSSRRRHTRLQGDWSSEVCSSDLLKRALRKPGEGVMGVDWESISARLIFGPTTQGVRNSTAFKTAGAPPGNLEALRLNWAQIASMVVSSDMKCRV